MREAMILRPGRERLPISRGFRHQRSECLASLARVYRSAAISLFLRKGSVLEAKATVNNVDLARGVAGFIRGQKNRQRRNLLGTAEAPHWLSRLKFGARFFNIALRGDPLVQRRGLHRSRTDRIDR